MLSLDGVPQGRGLRELRLSPGRHLLRLEAEGYAPATREVTLSCGQRLTVSEALRDVAPPRVVLGELATAVMPQEGLKVTAAAEDNAAVQRMALYLDGELLHEVREASLRHNVNTLILQPGTHELLIEAQDAAGNVAHAQARFELLEPATPLPSATLASSPTPPATVTPSPMSEPTPTVVRLPPTPTTVPVAMWWDEVTVNTYAYEGALYTDPAKVGHPYPLLHRDRVGPPRPRTYKVLVLRNEYLELTLMPELGGRIYQCRFLPTDQTLLYNNRSIKPTHWGPPEQGWWLAAGGIEFCLPVYEHGYVSAEPWTADVGRGADGSVTVTMAIDERSHDIAARVGITLRPGESAFHIRSDLRNVGSQPQQVQYWINAMLSPGSHGIRPSLHFYYPTSEVIVHSRGDRSLPDAGQRMSWPIYEGRDLSHYATWRDWLGFFAPNLREPYTAVYDESTQLGMVRIFPPDIARGSKLFGFGLGFGYASAYTDDGSQYIEMWGGLTPTFWDDAPFAPGARVAWEETWYVLSRCGGGSAATADAALNVRREGESLWLALCSPREQRLSVQVLQQDKELWARTFLARPDLPFEERIALGNPDLPLIVRIMDAAGRELLLRPVR